LVEPLKFIHFLKNIEEKKPVVKYGTIMLLHVHL
jgi:hypothetical protein